MLFFYLEGLGFDFFFCCRPCLVHFVPKFIMVKPVALKDQLRGHSEMEMDLFDAIIWRFKQVDDLMYADQMGTRWRHFVESYFMILSFVISRSIIVACCFGSIRSCYRCVCFLLFGCFSGYFSYMILICIMIVLVLNCCG